MLTLSAIDPMQPYGGYGGLAPQGAFGSFLGGIAPTLGGYIGGAFGNQPLGSTIGQGAAPLLRLLPFQVDPIAAAYGGAQLAPQGAWGSLLPAAYGGGQPSNAQAVLIPQTSQDPEVQAASAFVQDTAAAIIKRLHEFLQANLQKFSPLADAIPLVQRAAELYEARDYPRAYAQAYQAYRAIGLVRAKLPDLPNV
jgi:hypothetical protein